MNESLAVAEANPLRQNLPRARVPEPCAVVLFGASGDLTHRKLGPALYHLGVGGNLPPISPSSASPAATGTTRRSARSWRRT